MIPLKVPCKIVTVYDEGTPDQQYIVTYSNTLTRKIFFRVLKILEKINFFRVKLIRYPDRQSGVGYHYGHILAGYRVDKKYGFMPEIDRLSIFIGQWQYRIIADWYGGERGRTLFVEKNKRVTSYREDQESRF